MYDTATLLLSSIKEVEKLMLQLRAQRYEVQSWNKVISRIDRLEKRQAACAALIEEDQEVLLKVELTYFCECSWKRTSSCLYRKWKRIGKNKKVFVGFRFA